jgi:hypothetical protein
VIRSSIGRVSTGVSLALQNWTFDDTSGKHNIIEPLRIGSAWIQRAFFRDRRAQEGVKKSMGQSYDP